MSFPLGSRQPTRVLYPEGHPLRPKKPIHDPHTGQRLSHHTPKRLDLGWPTFPDEDLSGENLGLPEDPGDAPGPAADSVLAANPAVVVNYRAGAAPALGLLVGQVMRATRGPANAAMGSSIPNRWPDNGAPTSDGDN